VPRSVRIGTTAHRTISGRIFAIYTTYHCIPGLPMLTEPGVAKRPARSNRSDSPRRMVMSEQPALQVRPGRGYSRSPGQDRHAGQMAASTLIRDQSRAAVRSGVVRCGRVFRRCPRSGRKPGPAINRGRSGWVGRARPGRWSGRAAGCRGRPERQEHFLWQSAASQTRPTSTLRRRAAPVRPYEADRRCVGDRDLQAGIRADRAGHTQPTHADACSVTASPVFPLSVTARKTTS
jgi:hypothetical protein